MNKKHLLSPLLVLDSISDGATEVTRKDGTMLDTAGLLDCLKGLGYPREGLALKHVEEALLKASDRIRFDDDLTFLEIQRPL